MKDRTPGSTTRSTSPRIVRVAVVAAGTTLLLAGTAGIVGAATGPAAPSPTSAAARPAQPVAGLEPGVQRWLHDRGRDQVELNDALLLAQRAVAAPNGGTAACGRLLAAAQRLQAHPPSPVPAVTDAAGAGLAQFAAGATSCTRGDTKAAATQLADGVARRADSQAELDDILEGD